jgi:regulator of sirC expression with transglutaminase-like and TPR domain
VKEVNATCARARELLTRALCERPPRLDWAALAVSALNGSVALERIEVALDAYAERVRLVLGERQDALSQVQALKRVLADEEGFSGNTNTGQKPDNSFLTKVLEQRTGLPITLSVLYLEVARRAGIPLFGVSFPGHFLVACEADRGKLVMDPFQSGQVLTEEGCADLLARVAPQIKFTPRLLAPASVPAITSRMLQNLKRTYLAMGEGGRALQVIDLLLLIAPDHPGELRARAALLSAIGAYRAALADVERCLELSPDSPDQESLRLTAQALRQQVDFLH